MTVFGRRLRSLQPDPAGRRWIFVAYDQLSGRLGPLAREDPSRIGLVLVENPWKASRRPYHKQKLALVIANLRHFAIEQAARGVAIEHVVATGPYRDALGPIARARGPLRAMLPAERELRVDLQPLADAGLIVHEPHDGWLTTREQFLASQSGPPWRMDAFYRHVRRQTGILMDARGKPMGGKFSFDAENRRPWKGDPSPAEPLRFDPDEVTAEVGDLIARRFAHHPGRLDLEALPATHRDAQATWAWARRACLPWFGPFEDAMSRASTTLFHTRIAPLVNLHRLLAREVVREVARLDLPLPSREGFIRQVLGWREFVRHVHVETDGFRTMRGMAVPVQEAPGDGGYARWSGRAWREVTGDRETPALPGEPDGGAMPNALSARTPLPPAFWGQPSGLACLDHVVRTVWDEGYSHHITRLMVLSNLATLLDVSPRELTDWFWVAYTDAYDWVVEPNVLGMGTFATGDLMTTKPYVSGAAYLAKMSDYCGSCAFDPRSSCPITRLYWAFLARHEDALRGNPRMGVVLRALGKRPADERARDARVFGVVSAALREGRPLSPADIPPDGSRR